ncbi:cytochrome-c peroxidase [Algivirga pacifica]|uniref:Di-heme enzyme n=1 Tax=Algivirga pacifica TaxID=1162670 RepID=A0ABP9DIQ1_9BACT
MNSLSKVLFAFLFLGIVSCQQEKEEPQSLDDTLTLLLKEQSKGQGLSYFQLPDGADLNQIPQDPNNPINENMVSLGKLLYHDPCIGTSPNVQENRMTYSCASCHHVEAGFQAGIRQGIGEGGIGFGPKGTQRQANPAMNESDLDVQPVRSPSTLNSAYQLNMLWNGQFGATGHNINTQREWKEGTPIFNNHLGYEGVEIQAIAGLTVHRMVIDKEGLYTMGYEGKFESAFPNWDDEKRFSAEGAGLAIAAYERTLLANEAPFQKWLKGDASALTPDQKQGAILFFGKAGCVSCHTGPALSSNDALEEMDAFHALGMGDLRGGDVVIDATTAQQPDFGRGGFTKAFDDRFTFKTPQLYNLKDVSFFGHGGTFRSIKEVVEYKNNAVPENPAVTEEFLSPLFTPLNLSDEEVQQLSSFLEEALYDPNLKRYVPESLPSQMNFPNNDPVSNSEL